MTTPQNPGDGETPQDPSDPQNPYGTPPPPPPSAPPAVPPPASPFPASEPPATPIPAAPPPGGDPAAPASPPPYGDQPAVSSPPPAAPAYGQAGVPGQPAYGAPSYPTPMPGPSEPGKGMAITALVLSFLGCTCIGALVAIPLAIVVLVRSRDGRNHGKGLAIAAIIISVVSLIAVTVGGYFFYDWAKEFKDVDDLKTGQCITADGLTGSSDTAVSQIRVVGCSKSHDAEVVATGTLTKEQADSFDNTACVEPITAAGKAELLVPPLTFNGLAVSDPEAGDKFVCVAYNSDGSKLTSKLGS